MKRVIIGLCAAVLLPTMPALATKWECGERSNLPLEGKSYCAAGDFRQSAINLDKVLDTLIAKHRQRFGSADALLQAQQSFESYRAHHCNAENKRVEHEPYHRMMVAQCKTRLTNLRIAEIEQMHDKHR